MRAHVTKELFCLSCCHAPHLARTRRNTRASCQAVDRICHLQFRSGAQGDISDFHRGHDTLNNVKFSLFKFLALAMQPYKSTSWTHRRLDTLTHTDMHYLNICNDGCAERRLFQGLPMSNAHSTMKLKLGGVECRKVKGCDLPAEWQVLGAHGEKNGRVLAQERQGCVISLRRLRGRHIPEFEVNQEGERKTRTHN